MLNTAAGNRLKAPHHAPYVLRKYQLAQYGRSGYGFQR